MDAHQHYWNPARGDYGWMPKDDKVLTRIYMPADLSPGLARHEIEATVLVQAAPSIEETEYLLGIADATAHVAGVVGWVDFERPEDRRQLERLARHPKFRGVRPMIQDIPDKDWMLRADVQWGFEALNELDLTFDALGFPIHLENFLTILKRYPEMRTVIDHCMKPEIRNHSPESFQHWANGMSQLANETKACCKLSGLVTEASQNWMLEDLKPYAEHVLSAFGAERVMWGSDWPVCRLRAEYSDWRKIAEDLTSHLSNKERQRVFGETAAEFYRLDV
ncbi:amidohydrolase family protein [Hongsoonwoonella zoysiae]|uniref:amidohydrolase family protein n=1 Tax=Hongsoonwoonella zoysiae TaxID=2821844 RepID=UPI0031B63ABD